MCADVLGIGELIRHEDIGVFRCHPLCLFDTSVDAFTDIIVVVDELEFSAVLADEKTSFGTYRIRHDDNYLVAFDCAYE